MHSSRRFEAIIANWLGLIGKEVSEFVFLNALLADTPHDLKLLLQGQPVQPDLRELPRGPMLHGYGYGTCTGYGYGYGVRKFYKN